MHSDNSARFEVISVVGQHVLIVMVWGERVDSYDDKLTRTPTRTGKQVFFCRAFTENGMCVILRMISDTCGGSVRTKLPTQVAWSKSCGQCARSTPPVR